MHNLRSVMDIGDHDSGINAHVDSQQFLADLSPDSLDSLDDGDLRKACQLVLKRDIGPITDSTRDLYKLAVKRALTGDPIVFDTNNENFTEVPSDSDHPGEPDSDEEIEVTEAAEKSLNYRESLPSLSPPTPPPRISRDSPLVTRHSFASSQYSSLKRTFPATSPLPPTRLTRIEQRSNFLRNAFIVGIGAVLCGLILVALLSE